MFKKVLFCTTESRMTQKREEAETYRKKGRGDKYIARLKQVERSDVGYMYIDIDRQRAMLTLQ